MLNRRKARENAFIALFSTSFGLEVQDVANNVDTDDEYAVDDFGRHLLSLYEENKEVVNSAIETNLKGWNAQRLPRVNLAILRLSVAEILFGEEDIDSVVINEAVELAKKFGDESDYQFVNGVLGTVAREKAAGAAE